MMITELIVYLCPTFTWGIALLKPNDAKPPSTCLVRSILAPDW